ncbi:MAG: hypothetical protein SOR75_00755 [Synergistes jonesii]|uniref:hypothetical protein n=1 Tax=Synergistes jonesii TaxID=2754 RepID=UPI002A748DB4|nr:hypothetical protein [Synergistes jonesii]MDY2983844.1 hypothetical protein [Synergistes jonesii]
MTYIDAAMRGIKIDSELFTQVEQGRLKEIIRELLIISSCPGEIWKGAPCRPAAGGVGLCTIAQSCDDCWEMDQEGVS